MSVRYSSDRKYITENLRGSKEKWDRLTQILGKSVNNPHTLFEPTDEFYLLSLLDMTKEMLIFMGVHVGNDRVHVSFSKDMKQAGLFLERKGIHYIQINQSYEANVQACAAILAHELMHYMLVGGLSYRLADRLDNEQLTDMATIYAGLGVVVLNGFHRRTRVIKRSRYLSRKKPLGYYSPTQYAKIVAAYIENNNISDELYANYVMPGCVRFLPTWMRQEIQSNQLTDSEPVVAEKETTKEAKDNVRHYDNYNCRDYSPRWLAVVRLL